MATAKANYLPDLAPYGIRPALVEAKLITEKHAGDAVYVATLTEELRNIEARIAAMEESAHLESSAAAVQSGPHPSPEDKPDANWIRTKSRELGLRLRHIENAKSTELSPKPVSSSRAAILRRHNHGNRKVYEDKSKI